MFATTRPRLPSSVCQDLLAALVWLQMSHLWSAIWQLAGCSPAFFSCRSWDRYRVQSQQVITSHRRTDLSRVYSGTELHLIRSCRCLLASKSQPIFSTQQSWLQTLRLSAKRSSETTTQFVSEISRKRLKAPQLCQQQGTWCASYHPERNFEPMVQSFTKPFQSGCSAEQGGYKLQSRKIWHYPARLN